MPQLSNKYITAPDNKIKLKELLIRNVNSNKRSMSPPSSIPLAAENEYWTDEESEVNPFQYLPQDLPGDLWWYFCSVVKNESELGFWVETGEPCEIFCNSLISGFRTTLRFYEGRSPNGRKTDWVMQQYKINVKDDRALCRVFLAVESSVELMECILTGDYFELNDLIDDDDHGSCSSSSLNSSCLTMSSDEYFDSIALLQQINDDEKMKDSSIKFNISAPVNSNLVICPTTTVSLRNETCEAKEEDRNKSTSNSVMNTTMESLSSSESMFKEEKKENVSKTKKRKMMKYLCFMAF